PEKIQVIFNGVAPAVKLTDEEKAAVREKWGVGADDFVCAIIARLEEVKGHEYVLKAAKKLMDAGENVKIMIAGNGSIENRLKAMAEDMKLTNVIFTGFIREIHEIENIMDVQLNASYGTEATSLSLLEGMSMGVPAIVSDFGGNPYVIETGVNGIVVPKRDENALCDAILKIKGDRELYDKCSEGARRVFSEKFTVESMTRQIEDVYTELSAKKGGVN
ncbi:MAG: glycosyltransferase family 4 protein, partial [Clostridia bacterium]|nr:glycosyltransferase family 4 protein [Clostridia bacterium]